MDLHPYCELFPAMPADDLAKLAEDIRANGLREPVVTFEGKILDGRNRFNAATLAEVAVEFKDYRGKDALAYVISRNLHRRHLTESQRANVAARLVGFGHGGDRRSDQAADLPLETQASAAEKMDVSERLVRKAASVQANGVPELVKAIDAGEVTIDAAAEVAKLPKARQKKIVEAGPEKVKETAKKQRAARTGKPAEEPAAEPEPTKESDPDPLGTAAAEFCARLNGYTRQLDAWGREFADLKKEPLGHDVHWETVTSHLTAVRKAIHQGRPKRRCPYCKGAGTKGREPCKSCKGTAHVCESIYKSGVAAHGVPPGEKGSEGDE
jgi:ParB-like chromosome segregation protein Spo0J